MMPDPNEEIYARLAALICVKDCQHPVRVAIDGVDAAGKTYLADALVPWVTAHGRPVIRASIDGFHNPRRLRYRQGENSPEGYYQDSFNYRILIDDLLLPLGPGGNRRYRRSAFSLEADDPTQERWYDAPADAILLFDGVFLLRPVLQGYWDFSIFVDVDFLISIPRAVARDFQRNSGKYPLEALHEKYARRYVPGQRLYFKDANPRGLASIILDNNDYYNPRLIVN